MTATPMRAQIIVAEPFFICSSLPAEVSHRNPPQISMRSVIEPKIPRTPLMIVPMITLASVDSLARGFSRQTVPSGVFGGQGGGAKANAEKGFRI